MKPIYALLVFVAVGIVPSAFAQAVATNGTPAYNSFSGGPDVINDGNLNIHYSVPVFARAGRGIPFSLSLPVDNGSWYTFQDAFGAWRMGSSFSTAQPAGILAIGTVFYYTKSFGCSTGGGSTTYTRYYASSYQSPDNTTHSFPGLGPYVNDSNAASCVNPPSDSPGSTALDGSGISILIALNVSTISATVTLTNGQVIHPAALQLFGGVHGNGTYTRADTNGNKITVNANIDNGQINSIVDTLGTQPVTVSGGPIPTAVHYNYTAPGGSAFVAISYKSPTPTVQSNFSCPGVAEQSATSQNLIDKLTLPDGTFYQFFYEPSVSGKTTGRISQVTLPTGGTISYTYTGGDTNHGIACADGSTAGFNRVSTQSGTVQYRRTIHSFDPNTHQVQSSTTQITDNEGNVTTIDFWKGVELQRKVYQGPATGTPLETVITCYNGTDPIDPSTCPSANPTQPFTRVSVFRSLNGGPYSRVDNFYNGDGSRVTKTDAYDWGATSYTQETQLSYDATLGNHIVDHPSSVKVVDAAGNLKSETDYSYDDFAIPGDTMTCAPAAKCRGNLTKVTKYTGSTTLLSQMTYNLNGTLATGIDPNGTTTTTYSYGAAGCNAFPSQTQVTSGSITLTTSATYNCTGAVITSTTDANNRQASVSYTDPYFWRPHSTTDEFPITTTYTYTGQTVIESEMDFNANRSTIDVRSTRDNYGRSVYTQNRQAFGSSSYDSVQALYDTLGRPYKSSMPYQGTAGQAPGSGIYTQTTFDAMMRVTKAQDAGGGIVNTTYQQNDVYQEVAPIPAGSSESTKAKQQEYDGLGRLKSVCEITRDTQYGGACGQVTGGYSGYLTTYTYDTPPNVNSLTVTQNIQPNGVTAQSRTYRYDMAGRLTYESNPETGVNQYFYDSLSGDANCGTVSSPGDLVKTIDNKGLVACLSYDGLHRVLTVTYPNAPTSPASPAKKFVYESAVVNGTTMALTAGRLAEAYTCSGSCTTKITDTGFSYSTRGEPTDVYELTPHSGTYYHVSASYWEHGALKALTSPGLPTIYYGASDGSGLDGEGRVTKVTASSGQSPIANNVIYTASGTTQPIGSVTSVSLGSGDSDTFGYDTLTGRLTSYTFNMNGLVAKSGGLTWNSNGSLGQLALTDNLNTGNTQTCTYSHDDLGRIGSANCSGNKWGQNFSYDPFGNVTKSATVGITFSPTYNLATNRFSSMPGCTPSYDLDGNLLNDCSHIYTWQADGAVASVDTVLLTYDALGRVVEQALGSSYTQIVYSPSGGKLALMSGTTLQKGYVPLPGGGTAVYNATGIAYYRHADWLGSSRLSSTVAAPTSAYADSEYAPYGEAYGLSGNLDLNFTGQNQDSGSNSISGLYDFLHREYSPVQGRWISPDPAGMGATSPGAPQTWNRYAYVANGPLNAVDPLGLFKSDAVSFDNSCSMNGVPANCTAVAALGGMGGGGEIGFSCGGCPSSGINIDANGKPHPYVLTAGSMGLTFSYLGLSPAAAFFELQLPLGPGTQGGTPLTKKQIFREAENQALQLLKNARCKNAFGGQGAARISATHYSVRPASAYPRFVTPTGMWGMVKTGPFSVVINSAGNFYNSTSGGSFGLRNGGSVSISGRAMYGAFELLHELAHQMESVTHSVDDSSLNGVGQGINNSFVYDNCFAP